MKPCFSIIIPTLNEEKYLPLLLSDLTTQTFVDFEVIIVDGNSKDKTAVVAKSFESKLKIIFINSKKQNVSFQRNTGAKVAKSNWLIFMDADNRLPSYFMEGVKYRINLENPDIFTCRVNVRNQEGFEKIVLEIVNLGAELMRISKYPGALGAMIGITKVGLILTGGFNEKTEFAEDWEFVKNAFSKGLRFSLFRDPTYTYSLRRFKKYGKLKTIQKYAQIYIKLILKLNITQNKDYPMGGMNV